MERVLLDKEYKFDSNHSYKTLYIANHTEKNEDEWETVVFYELQGKGKVYCLEPEKFLKGENVHLWGKKKDTSYDSRIKIDATYRHFKGNMYIVVDFPTDAITGEKYVLYQALYGDYTMYLRPFHMFIEEVPKDKPNPFKQKYRFEYLEL